MPLRDQQEPMDETPENLLPETLREVELFGAEIIKQLNANLHKGEWQKWFPSEQTLHRDIDHHLVKLVAALESLKLVPAPGVLRDVAQSKVREHAADVAAICIKAAVIFGGLRNEPPKA